MFCSFKHDVGRFLWTPQNMHSLDLWLDFQVFPFLSLFNPWTVWIRAWVLWVLFQEGNELDLEDYDYEISDDDDEVGTFTLGTGIDD